MKNLKKVLALALAFACAFTMFAGAAFTDEASIRKENAEAVGLLTSLNIIKGRDNGAFDPEGPVTRAEMAKMIYTIRTGGNDDASSYKDMPSSFQDINDHWAKGYIKYLQNTNIIAGRSDTVFDPESTVTTAEAFKMALVLGGYTPDEGKAELVGYNWIKNTVALATTNQLDKNVMSEINGGCSRQDAAQILANTLDMTAVRWSNDINDFANDSDLGLASSGDPISVGRKWMDIWKSVGTLVRIDGQDLDIIQSDSDEIDSDGHVTSFIKLDRDYSEYMGQKVKVLFDDGKNNSVLGVYPLVENVVYKTLARNTGKDGNKVKFDGTSYSVELLGDNNSAGEGNNAIRTYINGIATKGTTIEELDKNTFNPNEYTFVDSDGNGKIDTLIIKSVHVAKVTYAGSDRIIAGGETYKNADENIAEGIAKDDWVIITHNLFQDKEDIVKAEMVSAKLEGLRDKKSTDYFTDGDEVKPTSGDYNEYQIDGNWSVGGVTHPSKDLNTVKAGENVRAVVVNGVAFYIKKASGSGVGRIDDVAVVVNVGNDTLNDRVKLAFFDGTTAIVDLDDDSETPLAGYAYYYSVSGGEYKLENLDPDAGEYYGDMTYLKKGAGDLTLNKDTAGDYKIDDNAQVILFQPGNVGKNNTLSQFKYSAGGNKTKVITGRQFNNLDKDIVLTTNSDESDNGDNANKYKKANDNGEEQKADKKYAKVYAFYGDMDGLDRIGALVVPVKATADITDTYNHYGYITEDAKTTGSSYITYRLWNGSENISVTEKKSGTGDRLKGCVIGFDTLTADSNGNYTIDDVTYLKADKSDAGKAKITYTAITSVSGNEKTVKFAVKPVFGNSSELDVGDNTTVLYVNTDNDGDEIGVIEGNIEEANRNNDDKYMANALVVGDGDDIELLVVEQTSWMDTGNSNYEDNISGGTGKYAVVQGSDDESEDKPSGTTDPALNVVTDITRDEFAYGKNQAANMTLTVENMMGMGIKVDITDKDDKDASAKFSSKISDSKGESMNQVQEDAKTIINVALNNYVTEKNDDNETIYTFADAGTYTMTVTVGTKKLTRNFTINKAPITGEQTVNLTKPTNDQKLPDATVAEGANFKVTTKWESGDAANTTTWTEVKADDTAEAGNFYKATVTLKADDNHSFDDGEGKLTVKTIEGYTMVVSPVSSDKTTVTVTLTTGPVAE